MLATSIRSITGGASVATGSGTWGASSGTSAASALARGNLADKRRCTRLSHSVTASNGSKSRPPASPKALRPRNPAVTSVSRLSPGVPGAPLFAPLTHCLQRHEDCGARRAEHGSRPVFDLLLVDANAQRRLDVWDRLVEDGYRVETAALGHEALERALSGGIDLVLLDVALEDRDGLGVCEELRHRGFSGALILVTDPERAGERVRGLRLGADDVLTRPFALIELSARIE
ncbi:MAG: response regulator, partial [Kofleriaceae bacterium]